MMVPGRSRLVLPHGLALLVAIVAWPGVASAQSGTPTWVRNLPQWQWYSIPGTALSSVEPSPVPAGATGPSSKVTAWCGAAMKRQGSVYIIGASGGHADYAGNEVDGLQMNSETPRWVQLRAPTANSQVINASQYYLDRRPSATHTYYASQFINARNRFLVMPSPGMGWTALPSPPPGWPYAGDPGYTFCFNMGTNDWDAPEFIPIWPGGGDFTAALVAKHPTTEDVYYNRYGGGWWRWTQASNTWTQLSNNNGPGNYAGAAIDPVRNRMLIVGSYDGNVPPSVRDLNGNIISVTFTGLGASSLAVGRYPGVVYDEGSDRFLVVFNTGSTIRVLRVNPATWFVDAPTITGSAPADRPNGIQNSAQYAPELGGIAIANSYTGNVYFLKTGAGAASPPDSIPPAPPTALQAR